ncbi:MAG: hypothetical protein E7533_00550 [Ruminococcaceae bacterium]|nr:hypothetical protein [Oscillospiraceae bacterium]
MLGYVFFVLGILATIIFLTKRTAFATIDVVAVKSLASMGFILAGIFFFVSNDNCTDMLGAFTIGGACFGMLGDIVLDLKYTKLGDADRCTKLGFWAFLIGHVFYSIAMLSAYKFGLINIICVIIGIISGIVVAILTEKVVKLNYGKFKAITILYTAVLCMTLGFAGGFALSEKYSMHSLLLNVGFVLFVLSDAFLAKLYFSNNEKDRTSRVSIILNHATYYAAQYIIALSLAFYRG